MSFPLALLIGFGVLATPPGAAKPTEVLPRLGIALSATSVSGLSSGAYMAGQIEVAHSKDIVGAGIVAAGPFACAETESSRLFPYWPVVMWQNAEQAEHACMQTSWGTPNADKLAQRAEELAQEGKIDPLRGLANHKVYLFSGNEDQTVLRTVVESAKRFYLAAGVPEASVTLIKKEGGHAFLTEAEGTACGLSKDPYVSACNYDQAKAILEWIYGSPLAGPTSTPTGKFITFDQSSFSEGRPNGLASGGVAYIPTDCESHPGCRLHIVLHGCDQGLEVVGDTFIKESGFARYADTNRFVILFPQIAGNLLNPHGCRDWWGYSDIDYLSKNAPQIQAIWDMAGRLAMQP